MKKQVKGILGLGAVLAVLGGGFAALKLTEPKDEEVTDPSAVEQTEPESEDSVVLVSGEASDDIEAKPVKSVLVINSEDELHVIKKTADDDSVVYTLEGYDDLDVNNSVVSTLANNGNGLTSQALIEEHCDDLGKFGLADPSVTVELTYESGKTVKFFIGDQAPSGSVTYVMVDDGCNTVYTVSNSSLANYKQGVKHFIRKNVLEAPDEDIITVDSFTIERDDLDYNIYVEYDEKLSSSTCSYMLLEPTKAYLSGDRAPSVVEGMYGLTADDIYVLHCEESDIAGAGLKDPFCRVTMVDDGNEYVLILSELFKDENNENCCYGMLEGGDVIYTFSESKAKWVSVMPVDIASTIIIGNFVWNITDMSIKCGDDKTEFVIEPKEEGQELSADTVNVTKNGESFDTERYRQLYSFLISANAEEFALGEEVPDSEPMVEIVYTDSVYNETTTIQFYDLSVMKCLIVVNGESKFHCTKSFVQVLIDNVGRLDTDEKFVTAW